ncbi:PorV/PorQ family protein [candidate division KSB1 bacterium]
MRNIKLSIVYVTFAVLISAGFSSAQDYASAGTAFLRIGMDARGSAMGGAMSASASGLDALQWNPAGLFSAGSSELVFSHMRGLDDIDTEFFGFLWKKTEKHIFAFSVLSNNIGGIEQRTHPTDEPDGIISSHDFYAGMSYATVLNDKFEIGITAKYLYQKIFTYSATGFAADFGVKYNLPEYDLVLGAALKNIGSLGKLKSEKPEMPAMLSTGLLYKLPFLRDGDHTFNITADYQMFFSGDDHVLGGFEYIFRNSYSIRGGFVSNYEERGLSFGGGINYKIYVLDYAYLPNVTSFGDNHLITFRVKL